ncbi:MAG: glutaredoxin family protein [Natronosporangium sp.]
MTRITLLTNVDCHLCEHAKTVLARVAADHPLQVEEIRLDSAHGQALATRIGMPFAPGILIDGEPFGYGRLSERKLRKTLARRQP